MKLLDNVGFFVSAIILLIAVGFLFGYFFRELRDHILDIWDKVFEEKEPPVEVGPTYGAYHQANENLVNDEAKKTGPVIPKSPALLEFEEQERIRSMNNTVKVRP